MSANLLEIVLKCDTSIPSPPDLPSPDPIAPKRRAFPVVLDKSGCHAFHVDPDERQTSQIQRLQIGGLGLIST